MKATVALLGSLALLGCTPKLDGSPGADDESSTGEGDGPGNASTGSMSSSATASDEDSAGDESGESTGGGPVPCPPNWPDDGSEVIEVVGHSSVSEWFHNDYADHDYHTFLADTSPIPGTQARGLAANSDDAVTSYDFGAIVGGMSAEAFAGKRVRMRSLVALEGVAGSASIWMRPDSAIEETSLALDMPRNHPDWGTSTDWELHEIVMDVPAETTWLAFGAGIYGPGFIVVSDATFEIVTDDVPTTTPNRRLPSGALTCSQPTDAFVEEVLHHTQPHVWLDFENEATVPGLQLERDADAPYDGVPTLHVTLDGRAVLGDWLYAHWPPESAARRVRLTLPVRGNFAGDVRFFVDTWDGETLLASRTSEAIRLENDSAWTMVTVVGEVTPGTTIDLTMGIIAEGGGELWLGYGVVEHVTDDVPLSPM